jgi:hypothetical protein
MSEPPQKNGVISLLTSISAGGDNIVKLGTLALVLLSGLGNVITTKQSTGATRAEVDKVLTQLDKIVEHMASDSEQTRKNGEAIAALKANQTWMLKWLNKKNMPPDSWVNPNE